MAKKIEALEYCCVSCGKVSPCLGEGCWQAPFPGEDTANLRRRECPACKLRACEIVIYLCPCGHRAKRSQVWHLISNVSGLTSLLKETRIKPKDLKPDSVKIGKLSIVVLGKCPLGADCEDLKQGVDKNKLLIAGL